MRIDISGFALMLLWLGSSLISCVSPSINPPLTNTDKIKSEENELGEKLSKANQYARDGLIREASEAYKSILTSNPDFFPARRNLGIVLVKAGEFDAAIVHLEKASRSYRDDFDLSFYLGEAYRAKDMYGDAAFRYNMALRANPKDVKTMKALAWTYYKMRFYSESLAYSQKLAGLAPKDEQVPVIVARVLIKLKREDDALKLIRRQTTSVSIANRPSYRTVEGEALLSKGKPVESIASFRAALKEQPLAAGALLGIGKAFIAQGKLKDAVEPLERATRLKPRMFEGFYLLGLALEKSQPQRALKNFAHFRRNASTDPEYVASIQDAKSRIALLKSSSSLNSLSEP